MGLTRRFASIKQKKSLKKRKNLRNHGFGKLSCKVAGFSKMTLSIGYNQTAEKRRKDEQTVSNRPIDRFEKMI
jgi:hypothetical protein